MRRSTHSTGNAATAGLDCTGLACTLQRRGNRRADGPAYRLSRCAPAPLLWAGLHGVSRGVSWGRFLSSFRAFDVRAQAWLAALIHTFPCLHVLFNYPALHKRAGTDHTRAAGAGIARSSLQAIDDG